MLTVPAAIAFIALRDRPRDARDEPAGEQGGQLTGIGRTLRNRAYQAAAGANLADGFAVLGVRSAIVPLFVKEVLHRSPTCDRDRLRGRRRAERGDAASSRPGR